MATRALIGYIENGVLTSTYNHYDGYPENLGKALENFFNSPTLAKDIAKYGYISYIDPETGEIEAANTGKPDTLNLNKLDPQDASEEVAGLVDSYGADYAYFYNPDTSNWDHIKNNGIRSMVDALEGILFQGSEEMDEAYHVGGDKEVVTKEGEDKVDSQESLAKVLSQAMFKLQDQPKDMLSAYKDSLTNDVRLNGVEQYSDYTVEDFIEDYDNYISDKMEMDESFARQMKYKAGIIK
jgi:hypothetical protein